MKKEEEILTQTPYSYSLCALTVVTENCIAKQA